MKRIVFCGGGSGGHVLPAITLARKLRKLRNDLEIIAIGSPKGIEAEVFAKEGIAFKGIATGKLRRYFSLENFLDLFKISWGILQSFLYLLKFSKKDTLVFGTGGFVSVPVIAAAWIQGKSIIIHEQTSRVGLANKICSMFADKVLITFESSKSYFPANKTSLIGYPLREEILNPPGLNGVSYLKDREEKPIIFITGGGNGSQLLNNLVIDLKEKTKDKFYIIHQCGKLYIEELKTLEGPSYKVFDFIGEEMIALMNNADVVISRSGAGTTIELMALGKPSIFVPLKIAQKNEQYHNAMEAHQKLGSIVLEEDHITLDSLMTAIETIQKIERGKKETKNPTEAIVTEMLKAIENDE